MYETNDSDPLDFDVPRDDRIEEGGWQKPVAPPKAETRPTGLPHASMQRPASNDAGSKEKRNG